MNNTTSTCTNINAVTNFDRMKANTYLTPEDFSKWVPSMIDEQTKIPSYDTFADLISSYPVSAYAIDTITGHSQKPLIRLAI